MEDDFLVKHPFVSRETLDGLKRYASALEKWTKAINLISKHTIADLWARHIEDSVQIWNDKPSAVNTWVDMGSGGGLPAIPLALIAKEQAPEIKFHLIESDKRKAAFLRDFAMREKLNVQVIADRIEKVQPLNADVITARALINLNDLLGYCDLHAGKAATLLLPKGADHQEEVRQALVSWNFSLQTIPSVTDPAAVILKIEGLNRV